MCCREYFTRQFFSLSGQGLKLALTVTYFVLNIVGLPLGIGPNGSDDPLNAIEAVSKYKISDEHSELPVH